MSITPSNKAANSNVGLLHFKQNIPTSAGKVQNSSIITANVYEIRPGGDVILSTSQGFLRVSSNDLELEIGDSVLVRIAKDDDNNVVAHLVSKQNNSSSLSKLDSFGIEILHKYITQTSQEKNLLINSPEVLKGHVSYLSDTRNIIKYGNLKPSDEVMVRLSNGQSLLGNGEILSGEILSNSHNNVIIQSSIGIININAKSNLDVGDKVMFEILHIPDGSDQQEIKSNINAIFKAIEINNVVMGRILSELKDLDLDEGYLRLKQLISTQHNNNISLTKLFYTAREVEEDDVDRWIDQEIVRPFESHNKGSDFQLLNKSWDSLTSLFSKAGIANDLLSQYETEISVPGYPEKKANIRAKKVNQGQVSFNVEIEHDEYGKITIFGRFAGHTEESPTPSLNLSVCVGRSFPRELQSALSQSFVTHKALFGIEGDISFENLKID